MSVSISTSLPFYVGKFKYSACNTLFMTLVSHNFFKSLYFALVIGKHDLYFALSVFGFETIGIVSFAASLLMLYFTVIMFGVDFLKVAIRILLIFALKVFVR